MKKISEALQVLGSRRAGLPEGCQTETAPRAGAGAERPDHEGAADPGKLHAAGEIGPETLWILARTWMDRYGQTGEKTFLLKSRDLYRQAFEAFPTG